MTQQIEEPGTPVLDPVDRAGETRAQRNRRRRRAGMIVFAVAAIAYVAYKIPPYLTFDPDQSGIPPENMQHYVYLSAHVFCGSLGLLTGVLQLWPWLRRKAPTVHRIVGRVYIFAAALPSAILAILMYPVTPGAGRVAIVVAGTLWSTTAILGWITARRRRFAAHRRWVVYSVAIMWGYGVGVFVLVNTYYYVVQLDLATAAEAARWTSWTSSLLIAHWWLERTAGRTFIGVPKAGAR